MRLLAYLSRLVSRIFQSHVLKFFPGRCSEDERLVEFSNAVTNSGVGLIGGSCTGGGILLGVVIYILYRLLKDADSNVRVLSATGHVPQEDCVTNQNRFPSCPRCRNVPSSPPPPYEVIEMGECVHLPGVCMSAPPGNSKQRAI